jgi:hypothetical protein
MESPQSPPLLDRLVEPLGECLTPELARKVFAFKADPVLQSRINDLSDRHSRGLLSSEEADELGKYVSYGTFVAILKSKARQLLAISEGQ